MNNKIRRSGRVYFIILTVILTALILPLAAADAPTENRISSVLLNKNKTDIAITVELTEEYLADHKNAELLLFELFPWQSTKQISTMEPVLTFKASAKSTLSLDYVTGNQNRLFSKFLVAERVEGGSCEIVTSAKYIENLETLAENTEPYPVSLSKKGLQTQIVTDAQLLGIRHATINIELNEYITGESSDDSLSYLYGGQTFYVSKSKLALLDHKVKTFTEAGMNVYFNLILTEPSPDASSAVYSLYCDGRTPGMASYALNTSNEVAMRNFTAFIDYIASRYTRPDHAYGFAPNFILGFEVNNGRTRNNAGATTVNASVYSYCTAFRAAYAALRSHYAEGRVFLSLGNNFTSGSYIPGVTPDPSCDFSGKEFLDIFAVAIRNSGDIDWGLSINPYASDKSVAEFWLDEYATESVDTQFITMKNIDVLTDYMKTEPMLYGDKTRNIIIGEFGVPGNPDDSAAMTMQAAAYALAYYKAALNDDIDAFIWHRHVDYTSSEGLSFGLWKSLDGNVLYPTEKKPIHNVLSFIDTKDSESVTSFVKATVGNGIYNLFVPDGTDFAKFNVRAIVEAVRAEESEYEKGFDKELLLDLTKGVICGFYPSDNSQYVELKKLENGSSAVESMLYARLSGVPTEYAGIGTVIADSDALKGAQYVTITVQVDAPEEVAGMNLMLRLQEDGDGENSASVFDGEVLIKPNTLQEITFKVKDFVALTDGALDSLKLLVKTPDGITADGVYGIWLESVMLHKKDGLPVIVIILLVLLAIVVILVGGYALLYIRAERIRRARREQQRRLRERQMIEQQRRLQNPPPYSQQNRRQ